MFSTKIGIQDGNVWFRKALKIKNYEFGDAIVCVYVCCHCPPLSSFLSPVFYFPLILYQSLILPHVALGFLALSVYLSLSVLLSYHLSLDFLFVCERENETMIEREMMR